MGEHSGVFKFNCIIVTTLHGDSFIIDIDNPDILEPYCDGCEDNGFRNLNVIAKPGVYKCLCETYWYDGYVGMGEPSDPDWDVTILSWERVKV